MPILKLQIYIKKIEKCYEKLKKVLPKYIKSFPVKKGKLLEAILANEVNIKKIMKIIHPEVRSKMDNFIKKIKIENWLY